MNVITVIKSIRDIMRKDSGVDGDAQRISQMVWMMFMKIFSDNENLWSINIEKYISPIPPKLRWKTWAEGPNGFADNKIIDFVNQELFVGLKALDINNEQAKIIKSVFEDTHNYMKNGTLFRQVINEINRIDFTNTSNGHLFNDIYESILKELQSAGASGEFYTPRAVTQFMVDIINPGVNESVLDPACGTGGFLTCAIESVKLKDEQKISPQYLIQGIEKKPLPHLLCITNLMLHGYSLPNIQRDNLLSKPFANWTERDQVDIILSNPPFGGTEEDGTDANFPSYLRTKETADLFMILIIKLLKKNGRAAVILPDSFLYGEGVRTKIKEELLEMTNLHTIVRLPNGIFNPYTNIKTNLLFFEKGKSTKDIWYFEHPYPPGKRSYTRSRPVNISEFDLEKKWWDNRVENEYSWKVSMKDIKKRNYNLDISSPYFGEDEEELSAKDIMALLDKSFQKSHELMESLKLKFN